MDPDGLRGVLDLNPNSSVSSASAPTSKASDFNSPKTNLQGTNNYLKRTLIPSSVDEANDKLVDSVEYKFHQALDGTTKMIEQLINHKKLQKDFGSIRAELEQAEENMQAINGELMTTTKYSNDLVKFIENLREYTTQYIEQFVKLKALKQKRRVLQTKVQELETRFKDLDSILLKLHNIQQDRNRDVDDFVFDGHGGNVSAPAATYGGCGPESVKDSYDSCTVAGQSKSGASDFAASSREEANSYDKDDDDIYGPTFKCSWIFRRGTQGPRAEPCATDFHTIADLKRHKLQQNLSNGAPHFFANSNEGSKEFIKTKECGLRLLGNRKRCGGIVNPKGGKWEQAKHYADKIHQIDFTLNNTYCHVCSTKFDSKNAFMEHFRLPGGYTCTTQTRANTPVFDYDSQFEDQNALATSVPSLPSSRDSSDDHEQRLRRFLKYLQEFLELITKRGPSKRKKGTELYWKCRREFR